MKNELSPHEVVRQLNRYIIAQEDEMLERVDILESCSHLEDYIDSALTEREARIIRLRYGFGGARV